MPETKQTETRTMLLNVGPAHPAMHGVVEIVVVLDGEIIRKADVEIGYLHRGFEKECESATFTQCFPYTDRLNYVSPLINNFAFAGAVEKLMGLKVPERCEYIRVILSEMSRVCDHLTCVGASAMELGAFSVFLYMIKAREWLWELVESVTGARLTISYARIGGVKADLPPEFLEGCSSTVKKVREVVKEVDSLLTRNRIFFDRMKGLGFFSAEDALAYGITGPFLRGSGVAYDVRKDFPYSIYDRFEFDIPIGQNGDNFARYLVRMEEIEQSIRIIEQAIAAIPEGPTNVDTEGNLIDPAVMADLGKFGKTRGLLTNEVLIPPTLAGSERRYHLEINSEGPDAWLPPKEEVYASIESLMNHFKIIMQGHGVRPPRGEVYHFVEGAKGELGFYVVSDGTDQPWRVRCHPPCFPIMAALDKIIVGEQLADLIPTFGSVNMIAGELDR